ncbi:MAG: phosphomethylpyrimidine synthase [Candidatus Cloacimonetes bacterium HGW-Cloacimonetes-2]|jgi:phosphomethylpyrimidine synthase|nr:MAG: phosphomethylpyrimidine synthase [Candidatus Cloacimonetes bacterium HGW-Cloacimonetes-2]
MTQYSEAKIGNLSPQMMQVAQREGIAEDILVKKIAAGEVVIPANRNRKSRPVGIGSSMSVKINANIGSSNLDCDPEAELDKLQLCAHYGAHAVMDLSTGGDLDAIRKRMLANTELILGTVPIYAVASKLEQQGKDILAFEADLLFDEIELQAQQGVDFMTVHAGINRWSLAAHQRDTRLLGIVSRGGSLLKRWMLHRNQENPLYEQFDRLLRICQEHDVTLSLGDGFRPGAISDASDATQIAELIVLGELVSRCRDAGVQVMVEGPGHVPFRDIDANMRLQKRLCDNAPFYVLGPLPTDFASGYDHITAAIGGALAASAGADFLCYVTPAEHLCLPTLDDVKQGIIASRIAAHIGDLARGCPGAAGIDDAISHARRKMDWETIYSLSVDPELARRRKSETSGELSDQCSMCGKLCAIKNDLKNA